jgi:hypothetical protein
MKKEITINGTPLIITYEEDTDGAGRTELYITEIFCEHSTNLVDVIDHNLIEI